MWSHLSLLACLLIAIQCRVYYQIETQDPLTSLYSIIEGAFDNYVDHFDPTNRETYKQRYWHSLDTWIQDKGPIFLYLCGEGPGGFPSDSTFFSQLARIYGAARVALEHRYYGKSYPRDNMTLANLEYLSHDQALADTANFIRYFKGRLEQMAQRKIKVIVFGGSYAGALSAWMRYKYPDLVDGALSSSGVVNSILNFYKFDDHIADMTLRSGSACREGIQKILLETEKLITDEKKFPKLKMTHGCPYMVMDDFMFYFADIWVIGVQYGGRSKLCDFVKTIVNDENKQEKIVAYAQSIGVTPQGYAFEYIKIKANDPENSFRQWTYQFCNQLAYFNTPGNYAKSMRFGKMVLGYWKTYCKSALELGIYPDTNNTNAIYGDTQISDIVTNVFFTNSKEDPWQWAGITRQFVDEARNVESYMIDCENCGHCSELGTPREDDPEAKKTARKKIETAIGNWLK